MKRVFFAAAIFTLTLAQSFFLEGSPMHHTRCAQFDTNEPGIQRTHILHEYRICKTDLPGQSLYDYINDIGDQLNLSSDGAEDYAMVTRHTPVNDSECTMEGTLYTKRGYVHVYYWHKQRLITLDIHCFVAIPSIDFSALTKKHFGLIESAELTLTPHNTKPKSSKIEIRTNHAYGRGIFATADIKKGELLGGLYGTFYEAPDCMSLPDEYRDHVMQCANRLWRASENKEEVFQYCNHSCEPNCGIHSLFDAVAMRDIKAGEEITSDYALQDDSNWEVPGGKCLCGSKKCRGKILPYRDLSEKEKEVLDSYVSHWILHKYGKCTCPK